MGKKKQKKGGFRLGSFGVVALALGGVYMLKTMLDAFIGNVAVQRVKGKLSGIGFDNSLFLDLTLEIRNDNTNSVTVNDMRGEIWYGGIRVARLDQLNPIALKGKSLTDYTVQAKIQLDQLTEDVKKQLTLQNLIQPVYLKGKIKVGSIWINLNEQITVLF